MPCVGVELGDADMTMVGGVGLDNSIGTVMTRGLGLTGGRGGGSRHRWEWTARGIKNSVLMILHLSCHRRVEKDAGQGKPSDLVIRGAGNIAEGWRRSEEGPCRFLGGVASGDSPLWAVEGKRA